MGRWVLVGLVAAGLVLAACGGDSSDTTTSSVAAAAITTVANTTTTTTALITTTTTTPPTTTTTTTADPKVAEWCRIGEEVNTQAQSGSVVASDLLDDWVAAAPSEIKDATELGRRFLAMSLEEAEADPEFDLFLDSRDEIIAYTQANCS